MLFSDRRTKSSAPLSGPHSGGCGHAPCPHPESGNIFALLFGAVALTGILAVVGMQTVTGPITTITKATQKNMTDNDLMTAAKILIATASAQANSGDCDSDGFVEPAEFRTTTGPKPTNGGLLPTTVGATLTDPWGTEYGYCVWDHATLNNAGCGGGTQKRLLGPSPGRENQLVLAVVAAGPDKTFQTTCRAWADANNDGNPDSPMVEKTVGSDDYIVKYTYTEAANTGSGLWNIKVGAPEVAQIQKSLEIKDTGGTVKAAVDSSTGVGDFLGITTDLFTAKTGDAINVDGYLNFVMAGAPDGKGYITIDQVGQYGSEIGLLVRLDGDPDSGSNAIIDYAADDAAIVVQTDAGGVPAAATDKFVVWGDGNTYIAGKLGLADANVPGDNIHIKGIGSLGIFMEADTDDTNEAHNPLLRMTQDGGQVGINLGFNNDINSANNFRIGRRYAGTNYWDTFTINTANGNVGVATNDPLQALQVGSGTALTIIESRGDGTGYHAGLRAWNDNTATTAGAFIDFGLGATSNVASIQARKQADGSNDLVFQASNTANTRADHIFIDGSQGFVGIGTSSPFEKLDVNGAINLRGLVASNPAETDGFRMYMRDLSGSGLGNGAVIFENYDSNHPTPDDSVFFANTGSSDVMSIAVTFKSNGNVGIGFTNPSEKLDVNGTVKAVNLTLTSDARFKEAIQPLRREYDGLSIVRKLKPVRYHWKDKSLGSGEQIGLIAQEVEQVLPSAVGGSEDAKSVNYIQLIPVLIQAVQDQQAIIEEQAARIDALEARLSDGAK